MRACRYGCWSGVPLGSAKPQAAALPGTTNSYESPLLAPTGIELPNEGKIDYITPFAANS